MLSRRPKGGAVDKDEERRTSSGLQSLFMMFMGALIAVMIGVFLYLSPLFSQPKAHDGAIQAPAEVQVLPAKPEQVGQYEFYEILPEQQFESREENLATSRDDSEQTQAAVDAVVVDDNVPKAQTDDVQDNADSRDVQTDSAVASENATYDEPSVQIERAQPNITYILQIRSFTDSDEADRRRAEVIMAGVDAQVVKRQNNDTVLYQVVSTSLPTKDAATKAYERLKNNGIDSLIIEQKHR